MRSSFIATISAVAIGAFTTGCLVLSVLQPVSAQGYGAPGTTTLRDPLVPGASWSPPGVAAPQGAPPPIGSGPAAPLLIPGDANPTPPPSGNHDPTTGSNFGTQPEQWEAPRQVNTGADPPTRTHQSSPPFANNNFPGPLPTVRKFCRYLVICGVVLACFMSIMAAYSYIWGHDKAADRVVNTAGGLIFLLMGYTIWKLLYMYICGGEPNGPWDQITKMPPRQLVNLKQADTPTAPADNNTGAPRSNMKVVPLGGSVNR